MELVEGRLKTDEFGDLKSPVFVSLQSIET